MYEQQETRQRHQPNEHFSFKDLPPFITAISALITAVAAFFVGRVTSSPTPGPTVTVTAPAATVTVTAPTNQSASPSASASSPPTASPSQQPLIFHQGKVVLTPDGWANLDATPDILNWQSPSADIVMSTVDLSFDWGASGRLSNQPPSYAECNQSGLSPGPITFTALKRAKTLCVLTSESRICALQVLSVTSDSIEFYATTYNKEGD